MKQRDREAARLESDYIARLRELLATRGLSEQMEILQEVRHDIEQRLGDVEPVTLVQMAAALQQMGSPESQAVERVAMAASRAAARAEQPPPVLEYPTARLATAPQAAEAVPLLNRIWWGMLVSVVRLYIPVVDLEVCAIIGSVITATAIFRSRGQAQDELRVVGELEWAVAGILLAMSAFSTAATVVEAIALANVLLLLGLLVCSIASYWILMTTLARWMAGLGRDALSRRILLLRTLNVAVVIPAMLILSIVVGATIGIEWYIGYVLLPISWITGYFFALAPIAQVIRAYRESATA